MSDKKANFRDLEAIMRSDELAHLPIGGKIPEAALQTRIQTIQKEAARDSIAPGATAKPDENTLWLTQSILKAQGVKLDGHDADSTARALKTFQTEAGLAPVGFMHNGKLDPMTKRLFEQEMLHMTDSPTEPTKAGTPKAAHKAKAPRSVGGPVAVTDHNFVDPDKFRTFLEGLQKTHADLPVEDILEYVAARNTYPDRGPDMEMLGRSLNSATPVAPTAAKPAEAETSLLDDAAGLVSEAFDATKRAGGKLIDGAGDVLGTAANLGGKAVRGAADLTVKGAEATYDLGKRGYNAVEEMVSVPDNIATPAPAAQKPAPAAPAITPLTPLAPLTPLKR